MRIELSPSFGNYVADPTKYRNALAIGAEEPLRKSLELPALNIWSEERQVPGGDGQGNNPLEVIKGIAELFDNRLGQMPYDVRHANVRRWQLDTLALSLPRSSTFLRLAQLLPTPLH